MAVEQVFSPQSQLLLYRAIVIRRKALLAILTVIMIVFFLIDVATGPSNLPLREVIATLLDPQGAARGVSTIIFTIRLPIAITALLVGAALALAGAEMQTILDNPMASPFTLGLSSAATLGAALAIVIGVGLPWVGNDWIISANAFFFALLCALLLQFLASAYGNNGTFIILFGIALLFTFNALVGLLQFIASEQALQQLVFWMMGSLDRTNWQKIALLCVLLVVTGVWSLMSANAMNTLRLGRERAQTLGVDVTRLQFFSMIRVSLLTGAAVAVAGIIGFVGLVAPHIARLIMGEDHRFFLPASAMVGAILLAMASILAKMIVPGVLIPIGIVTALAGVPVFIALIHRSAKHGR